MAQYTNILKITLDGTGTEIPTLNISEGYFGYLLTGTALSTGNYAIVATGSPQLGNTFIFIYDGTLDITTNGNTFSLFGNSISQQQLLKRWIATLTYNGSAWDMQLSMDFTQSQIVETAHIVDLAVTTGKIANLAVTSGKLATDSVITSKILDLNVTTAKINDLAVTDAKLAADSVITSKILDSNVTNAKLANMNAYTLKGNNTGGAAAPQDISMSTLFNSNAWSLTGNSGTSAGTNFIGTTDNVDLVFKRNNIEFGRIAQSPENITFGTYFPAITTGSRNTAIGYSAMLFVTSGEDNTAIGRSSLVNLTTGSRNTSLGREANSLNYTNNDTTCVGYNSQAVYDNSIALGSGAIADADYQFALPDDVTHLKFSLNAHDIGALLTTDSNGYGIWNVPSIDTIAGDSATINTISGRFKKDTSGATFTLTNSFITADSIILLTMVQLDATATRATVVAGSGSAVITFDAAPTANLDVNFLVIN